MTNQLSKSDWLEHGLKTLVAKGADALKAEPMAKALNVSRGSFYWHFDDIGSFRAGVLALWRERATAQVVQSIEAEANAGDRLIALLRKAFASKPELERAIRAWAVRDGDVAKAVTEVDAERLAYLQALIAQRGVDPEDARTYALFLYCAYVGQVILAIDDESGFGLIDLSGLESVLNAGMGHRAEKTPNNVTSR